MEATPADLHAVGLALGQEIVIRGGLRALGNPAFQTVSDFQDNGPTQDPKETASSSQSVPSGGSSSASSGDMDAPNTSVLKGASAALDALVAGKDFQKDADGRRPVFGSGLPLTLPQGDPRVLLTVRAGSKKAERIVDFLHPRVR